MIDPAILRSLLDIEDMPTLPEVMNQILATVENDRSSSADLTAILERDHSISARVLRMANSAFYGLATRVESIRRAVVVIGFDAVKMLALATSVFDVIASRRQFALDAEDFWMHSLGAAKAAQILAKNYCPVDSPEACFTAGLLHDIGKFVLALSLKENYAMVVKLAIDSQRKLRDVEMEFLDTTHAEVGAWIAEKWHFPRAIQDAIFFLHNPDSCPGPHKREVAIIAASDAFSRVANFGLAGDPAIHSFPSTLMLTAGLKTAQVAEIAKELSGSYGQTQDLLATMKSGAGD